MFVFLSIVIFLEYRGLNQAHASKNKKVVESEYKEQIPYGAKKAIFSILICVLAAWIAYEQWNSNISSYMLGLHMSVRCFNCHTSTITYPF